MWVQSDQIVDSEFFKYRLFGSGLQGQIFEVNLHTMCVENQSDSYGGPVWMMDKNSNNSTVACACEDGSIRLFDLSSERIVYLRSIQMLRAVESLHPEVQNAPSLLCVVRRRFHDCLRKRRGPRVHIQHGHRSHELIAPESVQGRIHHHLVHPLHCLHKARFARSL